MYLPNLQMSSRPRSTSDELNGPYSFAMLGSFSPYRELRPPQVCYECGAAEAHFGAECPQRFARVRGEVPPGWKIDNGKAVRDEAHWNGSELSATARAEYRSFLSRHPVPAHHNFPVSIDEITAPTPPPVRRAAGGRRP